MRRKEPRGIAALAGILSLTLVSLNTLAFAQTAKVQGMIKSRSGATMVVQCADSTTAVVLLTDKTEVGQTQGVLKVRRKEMSMAALIPGLEVQVEGTYDEQKQLAAKSVKFNGDDLERAQSIQAGLHQTQVQADRNKEELEKHDAELKANSASIQAAIARFGQLDDYYILDEVNVYFANGKADIGAQYKPQLMQLAEKAKQVEAFMIQVVGYASSVGSAAVNQKLSQERAANVTNFLIQDGYVPLTNVLAPGAMGESRQVGDETTPEGQAENRRVVVRVLQNKGIAGLKEAR